MTGRQEARGGRERATHHEVTELGPDAESGADPVTTTQVPADTERPDLNFERLRGAYDQAREEEAVIYRAMRQAVPALNPASDERPVLSEEQRALVQAHERASKRRRALASGLLQTHGDRQPPTRTEF